MLRCPILADTAASASLLLVSCGDAAVPQHNLDAARSDASSLAIDAAPPADACSCRAQGMSSRIGFIPYSTEIFDGKGVGTNCDPQYSDGRFSGTAELMGGSCVLEDGPNDYRAWLNEAGVLWRDVFPPDGGSPRAYLGWGGAWRAPVRDDDHRIISMSSCLLPAEAGATCARNAWISYAVETASVAPQGDLDLRVSCPDGVLVSGGCAPDAFVGADLALVRAGFAPDNRDEWLCTFVSMDPAATFEVMSLAFCLHEDPLPAECGCCPSLADSITLKQEDEPLRFGANRLQVQCDEGHFLVLGNCMIDVADAAAVKDVRMFRSGHPPTPEHPNGDRSTWGCSWYNPTGTTPRGVTTAVCLPSE
jgi:hypothetical protein